MIKRRFWAIVIILISCLIGYFVYTSQSPSSNYNFKLGLDLNGGTELVYKPDLTTLSSTTPAEISSSMGILRDVIERRVDAFGVSEPSVYVEQIGFSGSPSDEQLVVDLPGVTDIDQAVAMIGATPTLDFALLSSSTANMTQDELQAAIASSTPGLFEDTGLTGKYLQQSTLQFDQTSGEPEVSLQFNSQGAALFSSITKNNVGRKLAIILDGNIVSMPNIQEEIDGGNAVISGGFEGSAGVTQAQQLVASLNLGALPVPIELISTQTIGASLGHDAVAASEKAGIIAFIVIALFLILAYRLPGLLAVIALASYTVINLAIFKLIPVTLTAAGIAGFILSVGMAVDANILIFERMKEEMKRGRELGDAVSEGFHRAWTSIRDSNTSSIITAIILYAFSSTSIIKGFALVFGIGVLTSMLTAVIVSRTFLLAIKHDKAGRVLKFLFGGKFSNDRTEIKK